MVTKKLPLLRLMVVGAMVSLLAGCATMRYGGAPEPSFNLKADIEELKEFGPSTSIMNYYQNPNPTKQDRNKFIIGRLTLINLRYLEFVRNLTSDRQLLDSAVGMALLGLNLAGAAVPLANTKAILSSVAAGVTGSKEVIDKNYYFQKTISALVAQMNADRQKALTPLLHGMKAELTDYLFENAVVDLDNYYNAGTFTGAVQTIQADASVTESKKKVQNAKIAKIIPLSGDDLKRKTRLNKAIGLLNKPSSEQVKQNNLEKINMVIKTLNGTSSSTNDDAMENLMDCVRETTRTETGIKEVEDAFEQAGIHIPAE